MVNDHDVAGTMMKTIKLTIDYDGTNFAGWQVQPNQRTVQGEIEHALETVLRHPVRTVGAGRTDTGVHASGQTAHFHTESDITEHRLIGSLNGILPEDIAIREVKHVTDDFNARFDARARSYRYTIATKKVAINRHYSWMVPYNLDFDRLAKSTTALDGECDIRGFSRGEDSDDYRTIIFDNRWSHEGDFIYFDISAIRFFHHAVRSIVGTAVEVGRGKLPPGTVREILETRNRRLAGPTAPARGLCLMNIDYGDGET